MQTNRHYFSTRDLLMMAALAALGGVTGTYVTAAGKVLNSFVGAPGSMQWAAGLHVLWLVLAVGLTGKQGAGTVTAILKGVVELFTGNLHGILVVLVDVVAGLLVDLGFLPFRDKDRLPAYLVAGGLAAASNVFVFQLFAALPADILAYGAMLLAGLLAALSGVVFAGFLGHTLVAVLRRAGVIKDREARPMSRRAYPVFLAAVAVLAIVLTFYLRHTLAGPPTLPIAGAVAAPYAYPEEHGDLPIVTAAGTTRQASERYTGVPLRDLIAAAQPNPDASKVLIQGTDGYTFFVSMEEVQNNEGLLLVPQGHNADTTYDITGAESNKAWVRGVADLTVIGETRLPITGALVKPSAFDPLDWQTKMDATTVNIGDGARKLQGAPLGAVLAALEPAADATTVTLVSPEGKTEIPLAELVADDDIRLFTALTPEWVRFVVARTDGSILSNGVTEIQVH
ncbi:MAG: ECF transporter S component [Anaerolineae bacterium]|nr:ECF transporter S component [Anaerolineae bacterium]